MFGKKRQSTYRGKNADQLYDIIRRLCDIEDTVSLTVSEQIAIDIAKKAISDIRNALLGDGKIHWDRSED